MPATSAAFLRFLAGPARNTHHLFLLGDLFEAWVGDDDVVTPFHREITDALAAVSAGGTQVGWISGNRDFLVGPGFAAAAGLSLLPEPQVMELAGKRIVLVHGDAQCTDDHAYMEFRRQVRDPQWQRAFLAKPLVERQAIAASMRAASRSAQRDKTYAIMDVNEDAIGELFATTGAQVMVHGHTHRPAVHAHEINGRTCRRFVLPDWDCDVENLPLRGGWLALDAGGNFRWIGLDGSAHAAEPG